MQYQYHYGKKFYLDRKTGYWISTSCPKIRAHRWIWINTHGPIPSGLHIHHLDEDKSNNSMENLSLLSSKEHHSIHMTPKKRERVRNLCEKIRPLTKKWHASKEGLKWHSEHAKSTFKRNNPSYRNCDYCGTSYRYDSLDAHHSFYCSNKCKSAFRRKSGVDDKDFKCQYCESIFRRNKYAPSRFCTISCGRKSYWDKKNNET